MKRLLNLFRFHRDIRILAGARYEAEQLALWCIIQLRWPLLAEALADDPDLATQTMSAKLPKQVREQIEALADVDDVKMVLKGKEKGLDQAGIRLSCEIVPIAVLSEEPDLDEQREAAD
jgi:hypothetical protein